MRELRILLVLSFRLPSPRRKVGRSAVPRGSQKSKPSGPGVPEERQGYRCTVAREQVCGIAAASAPNPGGFSCAPRLPVFTGDEGCTSDSVVLNTQASSK